MQHTFRTQPGARLKRTDIALQYRVRRKPSAIANPDLAKPTGMQ
ncbi:hypothetical protein ECTPHS_06702 [Ectothiorhodospira sp. PHS-1]|nr:hypothetical protein ECTPHS_06702 [Ectothiorhodospira sp. PHS-1]